jgi:ParB/RepB/Spo0J family partition protein
MSIFAEKIKNTVLRTSGEGESLTDQLQAMRVPVSQIKEESDFVNVRQEIDREQIEKLKADIHDNGLKVPIVLRAADDNLDHETTFYVRAGFRRLSAVRELGWEKIPAVIIPATAPDLDDYWINLSENCQRESITPYEIACQTRFLVHKHGVSYEEISQRTNVPEHRLRQWVKFVQHIPDEILLAWKAQHPFLTDRKLSEYLSMAPWAATQKWASDQGKMPKDPFMILGRMRRVRKVKIATFEEMQLLYASLSVARNISKETREIAMKCIEVCMGADRKIDGIWPRTGPRIAGRKYMPKNLDLPDPESSDPQEPTEEGIASFRMIDDDEEPVQSRSRKEKIQAEAKISRNKQK